MKTFWEDLQDDNAVFYPDGLDKCPPETYTLSDHDSTRVRCISCPTCPAGEEPTPPCGVTLTVKLTGKCVPCRTGTFSDQPDSASCKVCTDCGSRSIVRTCTAERNTECKDCPSRQYADVITHTCKECSSCCGRHSAAQLECITSKKCRGNCSQTAKIKRKYFDAIFNRLVSKAMDGPGNAKTLQTLTSLHKGNNERLKLLETTITTNLEKPTRSGIMKRDINVQVPNRDDPGKDDSNIQKKIADSPLGIKDLNKKEVDDLQLFTGNLSDTPENVQEQINVPSSDEHKGSLYSMKNVDPEIRNANANEGLSVSTTLQPIVSLPKSQESETGQLLPPTQFPVQMPLTSATRENQPQLINKSFFLSSFSGTIAALVVFAVIGLIIYIIFKTFAHKRHKGYKKLLSDTDREQLTEGKNTFTT